MNTGPNTCDNSSYRTVHNGLLRMHRLLIEGKHESDEVQAIRDATDEPWNELSEDERKSIQGLSQDLYELEGLKPNALSRESPTELQQQVDDAVQARDAKQFERALALLRAAQGYGSPSRVSYLRGSIWMQKKEPKTAVLFFKHAVNEAPNDEYLRSAWLDCLNIAYPEEGRIEAAKILEASDSFAPSVVASACEIEFLATSASSDIDSLPVYKKLIPILETTLARIEKRSPARPDPTSFILSILAACNEHLRFIDRAFECYSAAIKLEPTNSTLLVARGKLMYGSNPSALTDFTDAISLGTLLVWPYFFLAHYHIGVNQHREAWELSQEGLRLKSPIRVRSELYEFRAIAEAHLGFPETIVRRTFEQAIRTDVTNERAVRNLTIFEDILRNHSTEIEAGRWETPTEIAVRGEVRDIFGPAIAGVLN